MVFLKQYNPLGMILNEVIFMKKVEFPSNHGLHHAYAYGMQRRMSPKDLKMQ